MRAIVVDDEKLSLEYFAKRLRGMPVITSVAAFSAPLNALEWLADNQVDAAFLDIHMRSMDGLTLAKRLKELQPHCAIVFVTAYSEYAIRAFKIHASGYLMKPASTNDIKLELEHILHPPAAPLGRKSNIRIQCFGHFEVFAGGEIAKFRYSKTKELLAYLVDRRGAAVSTGELRSVLWEDKPDSLSLRSQLRNSISDLTHWLEESGAKNVLRKYHNCLAVEVSELDCDYYRFLDIDSRAVNIYNGEYMSQYSWAEMTLGNLERSRKQ